MKKIAEIILDICVAGWLLFVTASIVMILMTSCNFNNKAEAMPPVHELYHELNSTEQKVYNSFNAEERANVNENVYIYQLKQAVSCQNCDELD
tara:strand:+ start:88 stop:366 length:279 start_codon:yes stop_codon:yes gene_type:complete